MSDQRPDPDELLRRIREQEERERRAKLKIFFGASAGVGKTYAMLVEAHERRRAGADVVVGVVETHGRAETAALLEGLEVLPRRALEYRGTMLPEFDIDAALTRHPGLLLLDELAHTNVPGSRHAKRWLDVEELLDAGIDVYTTLNVQHVEGLYDIVAQITGVTVREIVPDSILQRADEVELVDLPPDDLLQRLREGKVYLPEQAGRAIENFFRKGNLIALRELALRATAERVDQQMESYRHEHAIRATWAVGGRILVGVGEPRSGLRLIRAASRMAARLRAEWLVVHVETPGEFRPATDAARDHVVDLMGYAEELGAETAMLSGTRIADQLLAYARERNVSRIIVGKPTRPRWLQALQGSLVDSLVRSSGDVDVYIMSGEPEADEPRHSLPAPRSPLRPRDYAGTVAAVGLCTAVAWLVHPFVAAANLIMIYLLGVTAVAMRNGRGPAILASILSVAAFDFFFVPPRLAFRVSDTQYLLTFLVMLLVALVISTLAARMRQQADAARGRERRTAALYGLSRELSSLRSAPELVAAAVRRVEEVFDCRATVLVPDASGTLAPAAGDALVVQQGGHDRGVAQWAFDHGQPAGLGTPTLPAAKALFVPLRSSRGAMGVLGVVPADPRRVLASDQFRLLETFADQTGLSLERAQLAEQAERARLLVESGRMRDTLLSSVSHDLRTPLSVITGATSSLLTDGAALPERVRHELVESIAEEAQRLNRLVGNLLDMSRLESGAMPVRKDWHSLEEVIGAALGRLEQRLQGREIRVRLPERFPLVRIDDVLIEQVLFNLVENAVKYTPAGGPIEISAALGDGALQLEVADRGPGLPSGQEQSVFEKFVRVRSEGGPGGVGLGLSICRGIAEAHGGTISAANRPGGGSAFLVTLPQEGEPPAIVPEDEAGALPAPGETRP
jgi:two-component system sensor histidine kinase KdpD